MALWEMARHERIMGHASPEALIVSSSRPGELSISRGDRPVIRLRGGRIVTPTDSVLRDGPVAEFFVNSTVNFITNACHLSGIRQDPAEDDGLAFATQSFVESILLYTADLRHGGTLLFVPEEMTHEDSRLKSRLSIKYVLPSTRPRDALVSAMAARLRHNVAAERLQPLAVVFDRDQHAARVRDRGEATQLRLGEWHRRIQRVARDWRQLRLVGCHRRIAADVGEAEYGRPPFLRQHAGPEAHVEQLVENRFRRQLHARPVLEEGRAVPHALQDRVQVARINPVRRLPLFYHGMTH